MSIITNLVIPFYQSTFTRNQTIAILKHDSLFVVDNELYAKLLGTSLRFYDNQNFWTIVSGLLGALLGATFGLLLQLLIERRKNNKDRIDECKRLSWEASKILDFVGLLKCNNDFHFEKVRSDELRHFLHPPYTLGILQVQNYDIAKLTFMTNEIAGRDFPQKVSTLFWNFSTLIAIIEKRNSIYSSSFQPKLEMYAENSLCSEIPRSELINISNRQTNEKLKQLTDSLYSAVDSIYALCPEVISGLSKAIKSIDKSEETLEIEDVVIH
jgi:hypothetical protein